MDPSEYNEFFNIANNGVTVADTFNTWRKSTNGIIQKLTVAAGSPTWGPNGLVSIGAVVANGEPTMVDIGVARQGTGAAIINLGSVGGGYNVVIRREAGSNGNFSITNNGVGLFSLSQSGMGAISILTSATERVRILSGGNVGIGTGTPSSKLSVMAATSHSGNAVQPHGFSIHATDNKAIYLGYDSAVDIGYINVSEGEMPRPLVLQSRGSNVGIGKTNPSTTLDVAGTITATAFSGPLTGNASTAATWQSARSLSITGDVSATLSNVNGSVDVSASATIANGAVTTGKIANDAVTTGKIVALGVTTEKIADASVTAGKLATDSVETAKIKNANVTAAKLSGAQTGNAPVFGVRAAGEFLFEASSRTLGPAPLNIASATRLSSSETQLTFATALPNDDYFVTVSYNENNTPYSTIPLVHTRTTTGFRIDHSGEGAGRSLNFIVVG